jgi:hypothetical protein
MLSVVSAAQQEKFCSSRESQYRTPVLSLCHHTPPPTPQTHTHTHSRSLCLPLCGVAAGSRYLSSDISYFGVGSKNAAFYLGRTVKVVTKTDDSAYVHELCIQGMHCSASPAACIPKPSLPALLSCAFPWQ